MAHPTKHRGKWRVRPLDHAGGRVSKVFDTHADATFWLRRFEQEQEEIRRGLRDLPPPDKTFNDLADYWVKNKVPLKGSGDAMESMVRKHLRPVLGHLLIGRIDGQVLDSFTTSRLATGVKAKTVNNLLTLLGTMLRLAHRSLKWLSVVPTIEKLPVPEQDFAYLRSVQEIRRFLTAARGEGPLVSTLYATGILTGMRKGELAGLRWENVSMEQRLITVKRSFDGPTKAKNVRHVPILDPLLPILRDWKLMAGGSGFVFPNETDKMQGQSGRVFEEVLYRVLDAADFPSVLKANGHLRRYIVFHGLRHTFASHWAMTGGDMFKLQKIMGHKTFAMTLRYSHLCPSAFAGDYGRLPMGLVPSETEAGALTMAPNPSATSLPET